MSRGYLPVNCTPDVYKTISEPIANRVYFAGDVSLLSDMLVVGWSSFSLLLAGAYFSLIYAYVLLAGILVSSYKCRGVGRLTHLYC